MMLQKVEIAHIMNGLNLIMIPFIVLLNQLELHHFQVLPEKEHYMQCLQQ